MTNLAKLLLITVLFGVSSSSFASLVENKDYVVLEGHAKEYSIYQDKIEVVEFFSYGCPYCYVVEDEISQWLADKPENVVFTRVAIPRKGKWIEYARLYYALGMISPQEQARITTLIYGAIHEQKLNFENANEIFDWAESEHVDRNLLEQYYYSNEVTEKLAQAVEMSHAYQLKYVPSIYVNNQYQLLLDSSNHYQGTKDKLNELIKMSGE